MEAADDLPAVTVSTLAGRVSTGRSPVEHYRDMTAPDMYGDEFGPDEPLEDVLAARATGEPMVSRRPQIGLLHVVPGNSVRGGDVYDKVVSVTTDGDWSIGDRSAELVAVGAR